MATHADDWQAAVVPVVRALLARYRWQLLPAEWLTEQVTARFAEAGAPAASEADILRMAREEAGIELFEACVRGALRSASPAESRRAEVAYADLRSYLSLMLRQLRMPVTPGEDDDAVQKTLLIIFRTHRACAAPASFLAWVTTILRRVAGADLRATAEIGSLEEWMAGQAATAGKVEPALRVRQVDPQGDQELLKILKTCLDTDEERTLAVLTTFGLKRRELGMIFDGPLAPWDRVRLRVKEKLARCPEFHALFGH